jgi:cysteine desulfurase
MVRVMTSQFGNPSSTGHLYGCEAAEIIADARVAVAGLINAEPEGIAFLRGPAAAADAVLRSIALRRSKNGTRVLSTPVEHRAILDAINALQNVGSEVRWLGVDSRARLDLKEIETKLDGGCDILCVMAANNEVGTVYPIGEIAKLAADRAVPLLVDATQVAGHLPVDVSEWGEGYLLFGAHKLYGPKGICAVAVCGTDPVAIRDRERGEGTANVAAIAGFGEACRLRSLEMDEEGQRIADLRDRLESALGRAIVGLVVNGDIENRLPGNLHVSIPGVPGEAVVARLSQTVALSTGAACQSGTDQPSHVLTAMGLSDTVIEGAVRIGLGKTNTVEDIDLACRLIVAAAKEIRQQMANGGN